MAGKSSILDGTGANTKGLIQSNEGTNGAYHTYTTQHNAPVYCARARSRPAARSLLETTVSLIFKKLPPATHFARNGVDQQQEECQAANNHQKRGPGHRHLSLTTN